MRGCWEYDPAQRPNFSTLVSAIGDSLAQDAEYFIMAPTSLNSPRMPSEGVSRLEGSNVEVDLQAQERDSASEKDTSF